MEGTLSDLNILDGWGTLEVSSSTSPGSTETEIPEAIHPETRTLEVSELISKEVF